MRAFDQNLVDEVISLFGSLDANLKPVWGSMTPSQAMAHMTAAMRYGLGKEQETPNAGGFFGARIAAPLILGGFMKIPKNQKAPKMYDSAAPEGDTESLRTEMEEQLQRMCAGSFKPPEHPYFGDIGAEGWAKLHVVHLEHHLRQCGCKLNIR